MKQWIALLALCLPLAAGTNAVPQLEQPDNGLIELSLETFGAYTAADGSLDHGKYGVGIGASVFYGTEDHRFIGVRLDSLVADATDGTGSTIDYSSASLVLRLPSVLGPITPYVLGGVGRSWETDGWSFHGGAGAAYALSRNLSVFAELQRIFGEGHGNDVNQGRVGLRYNF